MRHFPSCVGPSFPFLSSCPCVGGTNQPIIAESTNKEWSELQRAQSGNLEAFKKAARGSPAKTRPPTRVQLVAVGLGRTGTTSLVTALQQLGYTPLHNRERMGVSDLLGHAFSGAITTQQLMDGLGEQGFDAPCWQSKDVVEWAAQDDKDVKVVLTVRDNGRKWAQSWAPLAYSIDVVASPPFCWMTNIQTLLPVLDHNVRTLHTNGRPDGYKDPKVLEEGYNQWNEYVRATVPAHKLLVFNVKQGWEPLCQFLNVPVPDAPFPHVNDQWTTRAIVATLWVLTWIWPLVPLMVLLVFWHTLRFFFWNQRIPHSPAKKDQ